MVVEALISLTLALLVSTVHSRPREGAERLEESLKFEGDIAGVRPDNRNAILSRTQMWPDARIPYEISSEYTTSERNAIVQGAEAYARDTCVRFVPRTTETDYLSIFKGGGCW